MVWVLKAPSPVGDMGQETPGHLLTLSPPHAHRWLYTADAGLLLRGQPGGRGGRG